MFIGTGQHMTLDWFLPLQALPDCVEDLQHCESPDPEPAEIAEPENNSETDGDMVIGAPLSVIAAEDVKCKLKQTLAVLAAKIMARVEHDPAGYSKAVDIFGKTVERLPCSVDSLLQKSLCSFGKTVTQVFRNNI